MISHHAWLIFLRPDKLAKKHDSFLKRYAKSKMKYIIGELRDGFGKTKAGEEFPCVLKVSEIKNGDDVVFIGIVKNISHAQELMKIRDMIGNMLPPIITQKLAEHGISELAEEVHGSVAFIDIKEFSDYMVRVTPKEVVKALNQIFQHFDSLCDKFKYVTDWHLSSLKMFYWHTCIPQYWKN